MGKQVTKPTDSNNVVAVIIEEQRKQLMSVLPKHINTDRFVKSAMIAAYRNPEILKCDKASVAAAIYTGAELGLDFTEVKGHAYIVPFSGKATFMPGYRGLIDLARRSGAINKIESRVVYENCEFDLKYGTETEVSHRPSYANPGKIIGAYAVAWLKTGEKQVEFMTIAELEHVRKKSRMPQAGPWKNDTSEMYRKTVVKRLFKYLPSSPDLERAIEADNEMYEFQNTIIPSPSIVEPQKEPIQNELPEQEPEPTQEQVEEVVPPVAEPPKNTPIKAKVEVF